MSETGDLKTGQRASAPAARRREPRLALGYYREQAMASGVVPGRKGIELLARAIVRHLERRVLMQRAETIVDAIRTGQTIRGAAELRSLADELDPPKSHDVAA